MLLVLNQYETTSLPHVPLFVSQARTWESLLQRLSVLVTLSHFLLATKDAPLIAFVLKFNRRQTNCLHG